MMHALVLLCIKQHTKFEVHSFTSQIYDEAKFQKKNGRLTQLVTRHHHHIDPDYAMHIMG